MTLSYGFAKAKIVDGMTLTSKPLAFAPLRLSKAQGVSGEPEEPDHEEDRPERTGDLPAGWLTILASRICRDGNAFLRHIDVGVVRRRRVEWGLKHFHC